MLSLKTIYRTALGLILSLIMVESISAASFLIQPTLPAPRFILYGRDAQTIYRVTNTSGYPLSGIGVVGMFTGFIQDTSSAYCQALFTLAPNQSCLLKYSLLSRVMPKHAIGGPKVCPNPTYPSNCAIPTNSLAINTQVVHQLPADAPRLSVTKRIQFITDTTETVSVKNISREAVNSVIVELPLTIKTRMQSVSSSGCELLKPQASCQFTFIVKDNVTSVNTPTPIYFYGANSKTATSLVTIFTPLNVDNSVTFSQPSTQTLQLTNYSSQSISFTATLEGSAFGGVTLGSNDCSNTVAPNGGTCKLNLTATSSAYGDGQVRIDYTLNGNNKTVYGQFSVDKITTSLSSGSQVNLSSTQATSVMITNQGQFSWLAPQVTFVPGSITNVTLSTDGCSGTALAAGDSCQLIFTPTSPYPSLGTQGIIQLAGTNIYPDPTDYAVVVTGQVSIAPDTSSANVHLGYRAITLTNNTTTAVTYSGTTISGVSSYVSECSASSGSECALKTDCPTTLQASASCTIWLKALAQADLLSTQTGSVSVNTSATSVPSSLNLSYDMALYTGGVNFVKKYNGSTWSTIGPLASSAQTVHSLLKNQYGDLYAGGFFTAINSVTASNVAYYNGSAWQALSGGTSGTVYALTEDGGGNVYAGGNFEYVDGLNPGNNLAIWNGTAWSRVGGGTWGDNPTVYALVHDKNTSLYVGGSFTALGSASGTSATGVASYNGSTWTALGTLYEEQTPATIYALSYDSSNAQLYAGGQFNSLTSTTATTAGLGNIVLWSSGSWSALADGLGNGPQGDSVRVIHANNSASSFKFAGGDFTSSGATTGFTYIGQWDGGASSWDNMSATFNNNVYAIAINSDASSLYAGGAYTTPYDYLSVFDWTTSTWSALGSGPGQTIYALKLAPSLSITS